MKPITKIILLAMLTALMPALNACDDSFASAESAMTQLTVEVSRPSEAVGATLLSQTLTVRNVSSGNEQTFGYLEGLNLLPGLYDMTYEAQIQLSTGAVSTLRAAATSVVVDGSTSTVMLQGYNNVETDDLIIAEIFFAGTIRSSGNQYYGDDYIKLYNNTDHVVYADGLTLFESKFTTTEKYEHTPDIMNEAVNVQALYTVRAAVRIIPFSRVNIF